MSTPNSCERCAGSGEITAAAGNPIACLDCDGSGRFPHKDVVVELRLRDIERALGSGLNVHVKDVTFLLDELRATRRALKEVVALAHDIEQPEQIGKRIRFTANQSLGLPEDAGLS